MNDKSKILIVDDESFYTEVLNNLLRDEYDISIAHTGTEALTKAMEQPQPDLILLDIIMEDMDGYEVCNRLKQDLETTEIPVIFLTVKSEVDDEVLGFNLGAVDYITKPMSPPIVRARVRAHIEIVQLRHKLEQMILANLEQKVLD